MTCKILVVDDDLSILTYLNFILSKNGHVVVTANDGNDAWEKLESGNSFDLVSSDVRMPLCDGFELLMRSCNDSDVKNLNETIMGVIRKCS